MDGFPYIDVPQQFFGIINTFGILMALGVLLGTWLARVYVERNGMDEEVLRWLGIRLIVWGFIGAYVLNTVFYEWDNLLADPWKTIKSIGISSYGAMVAGAIAFFYYTKAKNLDRRKWADMMAWGGAGGWLLGRLGCALAHDHLGKKTDFFLGVNVPPGKYPFERTTEVVRVHDLGLYEFFLWAVLLAALVLLERWKGRRPGFLFGFMAVAYSIPRFFFEYLRLDVTDPRYAGLTFAQWASIAMLVWGLYLLFGPVKRLENEGGLATEGAAGAGTASPAGDSAKSPAATAVNKPPGKGGVKKRKKGKR